MKICIWTNSIFRLGGTKRVITVVVNELIENNDITIMTFDKPSMENREMYGLDERVKIDYVKSGDYRDNQKTLGKYVRSAVRVLNNKTGCFNTPGQVENLKNAFFPKHLQKRLTDYLNSKDYDVIIATAGNALTLAYIADDLKAKTIGWQHNCYDTYVLQKGILFWKKEEILKKYFPKLDRYVVLNEYDKKDFKDRLGIECVAMDNPRSFISEQKTDLGQKQFFVAARFVEQKGMDLLIDAFAKFCKVDEEWKLVIAGDGPLRAEVLDRVWSKKIQDRVEFIGVTNNVQKYFLESSVYLLSSRWEGWGLVIVEAFEMGMPVIAFDIVPVDLLITNGVDGLIVDKFDVDQFAAAMVKLAHDEELRRKMGKNALEKVDRFSEKQVAHRWQEMLDHL